MEISQENEKDINNNISPEAPEENKTIEDPNPNKLISDILLNELSEYGYTEENLISQNEANLFFTRKLKKENNLSQKLFSFLNLTEYNTITISKFISSIFQLEEELKKEKEKLNEEFLEQKKIYDEIINMYKRYQTEKLNEEGFSENAKLSGEILETNFNIDLEGIHEVIIKIIFGEYNQEIKYEVRNEQILNDNNNKIFELKALSKKDNLQFILMTKNDLNYIAEIGSKIYSLESIINQDPFIIKVEIPSDENEEDKENFAAIIKAKIMLRWSDFKFYETQKEKEESKYNKLMNDLDELNNNIKNIELIFEKNEEINNNKEIINVENNKGLKKDILEFPENDYMVDFNSERIDTRDKKIIIEFNNKMDVDKKKEKPKIKFNNEKEVEIKEKNDIDININQENNTNQENNINNNNNEIEVNNNKNEIETNNNNNEIETNNNKNEIEINNNNNEIENNNIYTNENNIQLNEENIQDTNIIYDTNINYEANENNNYDEILNNADINGQNIEQINFENTLNINHEQNFTSYSNALLTESTSKILFQEKTLPIKYLPQKINQVIVDNNVSTLPLIDAGKKVTYVSSSENNY